MQNNTPWFLQQDFSYIMIPKDLYRNAQYENLSTEAKMMYGFFLDRTGLSYQSGSQWTNPDGSIFIVFPIREVCERLHCGHDKASRVFRELEQAELIQRDNARPGRAARIVLNPVKAPLGKDAVCGKSAYSEPFGKSEPLVKPAPVDATFQTPTMRKSRTDPIRKSEPNNTEYNNTDNNNPHSNNPMSVECQIKNNISFDILKETVPEEILNTIVSVMAEAVTSAEPTEKIGGKVWDRQVIKERLLSLQEMHIQLVYDQFRNCSDEIRYPRRYFLARLCEADDGTMEVYYDARVRHDMARKQQ